MEKTYIANPNMTPHHFDTWIMYQAGTGGNFLAYHMLENHFRSDNINLRINTYNNEYHVLSRGLHKAFYLEEVDPHSKLMISHPIPANDIKQIPATWDNIYIIKQDWFSYYLLNQKRNYSFTSNDSVIQHLLAGLFQVILDSVERNALPLAMIENLMGNEYQVDEYLYAHLKECLVNILPLVWNNEIYSYNVYMWVMNQMLKKEPLSVDSFKKFNSKLVLQKLQDAKTETNVEVDSSLVQELNNISNVKVIKYKDLFVYKTESLPGVPEDAINEYTKKNVELLRYDYPLINDEARDTLEQAITTYFES